MNKIEMKRSILIGNKYRFCGNKLNQDFNRTEEKIMTDNLLQQFTEILNSRAEELHDLQTLYNLKKIQNDMVQEQFKKLENKVLSENIFCAAKTYERIGLSAGDRITDQRNDFTMSESDMEKYLKLCTIETTKAGLTYPDSTYTEEGNTENQLREIKNQLINFAVEILPPDFPNRDLLVEAVQQKYDYKTREKIFELIMRLIPTEK